MKPKTIVLWGLDDLLSSSVEFFLTIQKGWKVINISDEEHLDAMIQTVDRVNPDVVIIHQGKQNSNLNLPPILLQNHPGLKVITVSLDNNLMEVYSKQNILVRSAADLVSAVEADT
jgi:hypothetical protein